MGGGLLKGILGVPLRESYRRGINSLSGAAPGGGGRNWTGMDSLAGAAPGGKEWEACC
jgi:hypothetical protein